MSEPVTTNKLKVPFIQFVLEHKEKWEYPKAYKDLSRGEIEV